MPPWVRAGAHSGRQTVWVFADVAGDASLGVSAASLVAVVLIGWRTIVVTHRAAQATEASLAVSERAAAATERSTEASQQAVQAATYANALMRHDARVRRIEAVLDVLVEMRRVWNEDHFRWQGKVNLRSGTEENRRRINLCVQLEARLSLLDPSELPKARGIGREVNWESGTLEDAIDEAHELLKQEMASIR